MPMPSLSPDFKPIEHLREELGWQVRAGPVQPADAAQVEAALL